MKFIEVETKFVETFCAGAITVWPFIFINPKYANDEEMIKHESVHCEQQRRWFIWGLGIGLVVWWLLYVLVLPFGWNYFRKKWETEAYRAEGMKDEEITATLKKPPYYLWWM